MLPILDLETAPDPTVMPLLAEELDAISAPQTYKDPEKIAAYVAAKKAERLAKCAVDIDELRIVALGYQDDAGTRVILARDEQDERELLAECWLAAKSWQKADFEHVCGGFCVRTFDLPAIIRRSQILGLDVPHVFRLDRFRGNVVDMADTLTGIGMRIGFPRKLEFYARRFGLIAPSAPYSHGADVLGWVQAGDWQAVEDHLRQDLRVTRALYDRLYPQGV